MKKGTGTLLIVEDEKLNIDILSSLLKDRYQLVVAKNGIQALKRLEQHQIDLILLDIVMPEMDGFETCRLIKKKPAIRDIPIIFLTTKSETEDLVEGFHLGGVDYIVKPFNGLELEARISTHLELKKNREALARKHAESNELLHILCHDLANPVGAVKEMLLMMKEDPSSIESLIDFTLSGLDNMKDMIDLVREIRKINEKSAAGLKLQNYPLKWLVETAYAILERKFKNKELKLTFCIPDNLSVRVEKTSFVNTVINNLLSNAIKFSYPGTEIKVMARKYEKKVEFQVEDTGIGIPETLQKHLFDISKSTSRSGTQGEIGTGFGMPLVKKFLQVYSGTISIQSRSERDFPDAHGTIVTVTLPKA
jgi:signal transduction histidine kinase